MRKLAIAVAIVVVLILIVVLALPHLIDVNQYRGEIQSQLQQRLNRPVQLGELSLGVFPVRIEASNVAIGDDPNFHSKAPFAQVEQLNVSVKLLPLLSKNVEIESLELKQPKIELIKNAQGVWNFSTIGSAPSNAAPEPAKPPQQQPATAQPSGGAGNQISLGELKITDGQIAVTDEQKHQPRAVYNHIDLTLNNFAPNEPFSVDLAAHLPGSGSQKLTLTGKGGPINNADAAKTPFKGTLKLDGVSMAGLQQFMNSQSLAGTDASITGTTDISNENGVMSANGSMKLADVVVHGTKVGYPINTDFNVADNSTGDTVDIKKFDVKVGSTALTAQGTLTQYSTPSPNINASVRCDNAKIDELLSLAQVLGVSAVAGTTGSGNVSLNVNARGPINNQGAMQLSGSGALQNVTLKPAGFTKPLQVRTANIQFAQNSMNLTNLNASLGSTNASGNMSVANFETPHITFALSADKVNVTELQQITGGASQQPAQKRASADWSLVPSAEAAPASSSPSMLETATGNGTLAVGNITYQQIVLTNVHSNVELNRGVVQLNPLTSQVFGGQQSGSITIDTRPNPMTYAANIKLANVDANQMLSSVSSVKNTLYGTLGATTNVTFATPASGDIAQTLNGTLAMNLANGKIMKLDLPSELSKIGKFGGTSAKGYTAISQMSGTFNVHQGVAQTNDLKAALDIGTMAATGTMNLVNQGLNMHVTAVLNKGFSQSVGGTGIGGYANTALGNKNGELVLPVLVTGTMDHPIVAPDMEQIAKMKLNNILPTAEGVLSGKGGASSILGGLLGGQPQQGAKPNQQQQQQNGLGGVLNGILGGGKKH